MKKSFSVKLPIIIVIVIFMIASNTYAVNSTPDLKSYETSLKNLNILRGSYTMETKVKRSEFITWIVRAMGYDQDDASKISMPCKDVKKGYWAYDNLKIAFQYGLISMYPDKTIKPDNLITPSDAMIIMIKALGYTDDMSKSSFKDILDKAASLGLYIDIKITENKSLTHGQAYILLYNFMNAGLND